MKPPLLTAAVLAAAALAPGARAQVEVRAPFVRVQTGPGVYVRAPFVRIFVPTRQAPPPVVLPAPLAVEPGGPPPVPAEVIKPAAARAPTLAEVARVLKANPEGGKYELIVEHPCTCQPVKVCFSLPPGCPKRVVARKSELVIRYGPLRAVVIQFNRDGTYKVRG